MHGTCNGQTLVHTVADRSNGESDLNNIPGVPFIIVLRSVGVIWLCRRMQAFYAILTVPGETIKDTISWHNLSWHTTSWHTTSWHTLSWQTLSWHTISRQLYHGTPYCGTPYHGTHDGTPYHGTPYHTVEFYILLYNIGS